ncbi:MAG: hypothetical protein HQL84_15670 [Magnetococcales bacterium]|nr:hypothetical protein [Magnetococcales bacterium]MBF0151459.1 hypothetical protein [Magnetococcales bacterium]MBF0174485.1 hypothetical protein [Magnetococcales bacterium]MBF0346971.1 hypothetical protein [Magnetococcales bacterium]MBF0632482.1 hypothetical protein [Magnetococcales bacterium]
MSQETWTKKKPAARHAVVASSTTSTTKSSSRPWNIKPSILANQKVERRIRKVAPALTAKQSDAIPVMRKQRSWQRISGKDLGLRALEGSVYLVAGLSMFARNSLESLIGMFRNSREAMNQFALLPQEEIGYADDDRVEPEMLTEPGFTPSFDTVDPRNIVEEQKMTFLQEEEFGLPSDVLDDQAGALRSLISDQQE